LQHACFSPLLRLLLLSSLLAELPVAEQPAEQPAELRAVQPAAQVAAQEVLVAVQVVLAAVQVVLVAVQVALAAVQACQEPAWAVQVTSLYATEMMSHLSEVAFYATLSRIHMRIGRELYAASCLEVSETLESNGYKFLGIF
jgi:hypothetical protein